MLLLGGVAADFAAARRRLEQAIADGSALVRFRELITAQGGDAAVIDDYARLPQAPVVRELPAPTSGYVTAVDPMAVAQAALLLGAGRRIAAAAVDHAVGVTDLVKIGEYVPAGGRLCTVHARTDADLTAVRQPLSAAFTTGSTPVSPPPLIDELIE
jgi:thymidine phosphorylase